MEPFNPAGKIVRDVYIAREYDDIAIPIEDLLVGGELRLYPEVVGKDFFRIGLQKRKVVVKAGSYVGLIPINDRVVIDIRPRVKVRNLMHLLLVTGHMPKAIENRVRWYDTQAELLPSLADSLTQALLDSVETVKALGIHHSYQCEEVVTSFPRGRILLGETIRRKLARGVNHEVYTQQYIRSADTATNRCIKYAVWYLAQRYRRMKVRTGVVRLIAGLNRAYHTFDDVKLDTSRRFLGERTVLDPDLLPVTHAHYKAPLGLAKAIIEDRGIRFDGSNDEVEMASLLIKLDDVFEKYMRVTLRAQLADLEPAASVLDGNDDGSTGGSKYLFDDSTKTKANPDIVLIQKDVEETNEQYPLIIDAKYKPFKNIPDRDSLNQIIAYAASYRSHSAVIVHPLCDGSAERGLHLVGKIGSTIYYQYVFDIGAEDLEVEERAFGEAMRGLAVRTTSDEIFA